MGSGFWVLAFGIGFWVLGSGFLFIGAVFHGSRAGFLPDELRLDACKYLKGLDLGHQPFALDRFPSQQQQQQQQEEQIASQ